MIDRKVLFTNESDKTKEALETFENIRSCIYTMPNIGSSGQHEIISCDCIRQISTEQDGLNIACGEDSDCINRLTSVECVNSSRNSCGMDCQNQRFQKRQYSDISIFRTNKKGFGVRANRDLQEGQFIYEYIGEVIHEAEFRKRMIQYDAEGIKHFYFMMLQKDEFIDATKKGCLARFCNHSCLPNAYVDKWVVGNRLRMGIFAKKYIQKGEEICFDYNVDRYGADPQPCFCEEENCVGFLGGKTQTESANLLPKAFADALGIRSSEEKEWLKYKKRSDKSFRVKNNSSNINEEFVEGCMMRPLVSKDVPKVMAVLMLPDKDNLIVKKLIERLYLTQFEDEKDEMESVNRYIIRLHGFKAISVILNEVWSMGDMKTSFEILTILNNWHCKTKNKIVDSGIEDIIKHIADSTVTEDDEKLQIDANFDEEFVSRSKIHKKAVSLADAWSILEVEFKIRKTSPSADSDQRAVVQNNSKTVSLRRSQPFENNELKTINTGNETSGTVPDKNSSIINKNNHASSSKNAIYESKNYQKSSLHTTTEKPVPSIQYKEGMNNSTNSYTSEHNKFQGRYTSSNASEYSHYAKDKVPYYASSGYQTSHHNNYYGGRPLYTSTPKPYYGRGGRPYSRGRGYSSRAYSHRNSAPYYSDDRNIYSGYEKQNYARSFEDQNINYKSEHSKYKFATPPPHSHKHLNQGAPIRDTSLSDTSNGSYYSKQTANQKNVESVETVKSEPTAAEKQKLTDEVFKTVVKNATEANRQRIESEMKLQQGRILSAEILSLSSENSSTNGSSGFGKTQGSSLNESSLQKLWSKQFAIYVPNMVKGYSENSLTKDEIKDLSRSLVQNLSNKELKRHQITPPKSFKDEKIAKIRIFVKDYMKKYISKKSQRQIDRKRLNEEDWGSSSAHSKKVKDI